MDSASGFLAGNFSGGKSIVMQTSTVFRPKFQEEGVYDRKSDPDAKVIPTM